VTWLCCLPVGDLYIYFCLIQLLSLVCVAAGLALWKDRVVDTCWRQFCTFHLNLMKSNNASFNTERSNCSILVEPGFQPGWFSEMAVLKRESMAACPSHSNMRTWVNLRWSIVTPTRKAWGARHQIGEVSKCRQADNSDFSDASQSHLYTHADSAYVHPEVVILSKLDNGTNNCWWCYIHSSHVPPCRFVFVITRFIVIDVFRWAP
jgi:hypothetical protein